MSAPEPPPDLPVTAAYLERSPDAILVYDSSRRLRYANPAAQALLEASPGELAGRHNAELADAAGAAALDGALAACLAAGTGERRDHALTLGGRDRHLDIAYTPVPDTPAGVQVVAVLRDVSAAVAEQRDQARDLAQARDAAQAADRAKAEFLATMSHEIRTPLNGILGFSDLILGEDDLGTIHRHAGKVKDSASRLLELLNDVLDLSKLQAGRFELDASPFALRRTVETTCSALSAQAATKGLAFQVAVAEEVPDQLLGDASRLRQILLNLAGNAIKFTERGRVRIDVGLAEETGESVWLRLAVTDTGPGIAEADQQRIFEPFHQGDSSGDRAAGTGLGLDICRRLVALMGGEMGVASRPGAGSRFWLLLPFGRASEASAAPPASRSASAEGVDESRLGRPFHVLVAEDNLTNQLLLKALVEKLGHIPTIVSNGREAVEAIDHAPESFDTVLMDVEMPELDGKAATRELFARSAAVAQGRVPIYGLSAHAGSEDVAAGREAGMADYLIKPVDKARLRKIFEQL